MSDTLPPCPECSSKHSYELGTLLVCPECAHEWIPGENDQSAGSDTAEHTDGDGDVVEIRDSVGNILSDGDTVIVIKGLKVKGRDPIKAGTRVRNILLVDGVGDHDIECKIEGVGQMQLKSSVVRKA